jgi:2-amino-4-hydroxy-6-hydroxymethyldihydropteridine diphosphokinase
MTTIAFLGLGGNLGEPETSIRIALRLIEDKGLGRVVRVSSLYRTEPVGVKEQPWFVNAAAAVATELGVVEFHQGLQGIEEELGRGGARINDGPRFIYLDILLWGSGVV